MTPEELRQQTQKLIQDSVNLVNESTEYAERACAAWASGNYLDYYKQIGEETEQRLDDEYASLQADDGESG